MLSQERKRRVDAIYTDAGDDLLPRLSGASLFYRALYGIDSAKIVIPLQEFVCMLFLLFAAGFPPKFSSAVTFINDTVTYPFLSFSAAVYNKKEVTRAFPFNWYNKS